MGFGALVRKFRRTKLHQFVEFVLPSAPFCSCESQMASLHGRKRSVKQGNMLSHMDFDAGMLGRKPADYAWKRRMREKLACLFWS